MRVPSSFRVVAQAVGYFEPGDWMSNTPETRTILQQDEAVEGHILQRQQGQS